MGSISDSIDHVFTSSENDSEKEKVGRESDRAKQVGNGKEKKKTKKNRISDAKSKDQYKPRYTVYKYSNRGKSILREAVIVSGLPVFLQYDNNEFKIVENIEEASRIIRPPNPEEYPYEPYEFENTDEIKRIAKQARSVSIESLYI